MGAAFDSAKYLKDIAALYRADEEDCLGKLFPSAHLNPESRTRASSQAGAWIEVIRRTHRPEVGVNDLLSRYGLTSQEGLALMCLAEALLRIPDSATADALIRDKLNETQWNAAMGEGAPWAMNVAGWALAVTGKVIQLDDPTKEKPGTALGKLVSRLGQPVIREAIKAAMQWLAGQFVTGETIAETLTRTKPDMEKGVRFSFDMLGEGARTAEDAERYWQDYANAIDAIGAHQAKHQFKRASGISVKLSALHPRYEMAQKKRVMDEMLPQLVKLCERAAAQNISLTIDAEEADRLQLSLEIAAALLDASDFGGWQGLGFAIQAYQKRAPAVIDFFVALARARKKRLHLRLVKGAYWDSEIKRAQERGWDDFPVFTRKISTDVSYLAGAKRLLEASEWIDPVFGSHNAMTIAHIAELARGVNDRLEFQHLHGMGEDLYELMHKDGFNTCVYAPVGNHDVLLGYLVRRILENGANSSFVHRLLDRRVSISELTADPVEELRVASSIRHPSIRMPLDLYMPERRNSEGLDLADPYVTEPLLKDISRFAKGYQQINGDPMLAGPAFTKANAAFPGWTNMDVASRAAVLERLSDLLEKNRAELMALLINEAGKSVPDALGEVREATDFCRYYAARAKADFVPVTLPGPVGELNQIRLMGRGVFVCISPWNFPLAIFLGQIVAALVAGNCVIAKPAPQTPQIALRTAQLAIEAGLPRDVLQVLPGGTDVGAALVQHKDVAGVAFTGSTAAAQTINRALAAKNGPIVPLIAETGGQNALIVDSSALPEQVIDDVLTSSFRSAGQRCSALRVLCLPDPTADKILTMLKGAMKQLRVGDPGRLDTDVGPVIDKIAQQRLFDHIACLKKEAKEIYTLESASDARGTFVAPQAWEIPSIGWLTGEVFGPILHVIRYRPENLSKLIADINATGFGLTGGVHSRIEDTVVQVTRDLRVGNLYVNRSLIGAVVGVQPFGGEGLSGTGPKAGGPHYLARFATERVVSNNTTAAGGNASLIAATGE